VSDIKPTDEITTIEGLPASVGKPLHPMQQAWLDYDVAQCGYCQPGQIMAAVAKVRQARAAGHEITDKDLDELRIICPLRHLLPHPRGDQGRCPTHVATCPELTRVRPRLAL